ncbi:MAG: sensor histidine kinase [Frankiales bacterium]|nr:sensor histidine kinase [Frankiales bacterium]
MACAGRRRTGGWSLAAQILVLQLLVVLVMGAVAATVGVQQIRAQIMRQEGARTLAVAKSVAVAPVVRQAISGPDSSRVLQPLAESVRSANALAFVVIADRNQVRLAHPDPTQIGRRLSTDASDALAGRDVVIVERGTLGRSVRAKVAIHDDTGAVIGVVSVGSLVDRVGEQVQAALPRLAGYVVLALLLGLSGSLLLARRLKRQTFGLEPAEIGRLLEQREATLHGIREGLMVVDAHGRVTLVNDEAVRLLNLPADIVGRALVELDLSSRLRDVLAGVGGGSDQIVLRGGRVLVLNHKPLEIRGRGIGAVTTLRDRTELDNLMRELDGARSVTDALRAQAHEFANRMHTVAGLLELAEYDEALRFVEGTAAGADELVARLTDQVAEPAVVALLLAKASSAAERGAELRVSSRTRLRVGSGVDPEALITVLGNLVDNALEALSGQPGWVEVELVMQPEGVLVEVRDSGPGIAPGLADEVFRDGFTTKVAQHAGARGLGLALTRQACVTRGGWVQVHNDGGAVFTALLPYDRAPVGLAGAR